RRLIRSPWADLALVALAYVGTFALSPMLYPQKHASWALAVSSTGESHVTLAGWWRMLVSQPLFLALTAVWLWRLLLWPRFLSGTSRLNLRLVASHPDLMGGLRFVLVPLRGFSILALGIGAIAAGSVADAVIFEGVPLASFRFLIGAQVVL